MKKITTLFILLYAVLTYGSSWHYIEGKYARVEYTTGNFAVADSLLEIAEMAIPRLAGMTGISLHSFENKKTRIILTDAPDVTNGYAIGNAIVIYALSSGFALSWSNNDSWYKMVLTHELTHHTVFRATRRKLSILGTITDTSVPRWFHEGIAQYFAETWNTYRGDIFLKNAILSGQLSFNAIDNWTDGAILYAGGHAFVRWLAWQYGDSSLIRLLRFEPDGWLYDFEEAFEKVYDKSPESAFAEFLRHMIIYYGDRLAAYPVEKYLKKIPAGGLDIFDILPYDTSDSTYIITAKLDPVQSYRTAAIARLEKKEYRIIKIITDNFNTDLFINKEKRLLAYGRYSLSTVHNQTGIRFNWFVYDIKKDREHLIAENIRARSAAFNTKNSLVLVNTYPSGSVLVQYDINTAKNDTLFQTKMPIGIITAPDSLNLIFDAQRSNGWHDLFLWNKTDKKLTNLTQDSLIDFHPVIINDTLLAFNRIIDKNLAVATYNLRTGKCITHLNDQYAYWLKHYDAQNGQLIVSRWESKRKTKLFTTDIDSLLSKTSAPDLTTINPQYTLWEKKIPYPVNLQNLPDTTLNLTEARPKPVPQFPMMHLLSAGLPFYFGEESGWALMGLTAWADPLQRQFFQLTFFLDQEGMDESLIMAAHMLRAWDQTFTTSYYHGPVIFSFDNGRYVRTYQDVFSFNWSHPYYLRGNSRLKFTPALSYNVYQYKMKDKGYNIPEKYTYHGPVGDISFRYVLPTRYGSALYKRMVFVRLNFFQSLESDYNFNIAQMDLHLATNILTEDLGIKTRFNITSTSGTLPPLNRMGIDRFFGIDVPRDLTYTKTVRGVREDLSAKSMFWSSAEVSYMLSEKSSMKILFLPVDLVTITAFFDYARLNNQDIVNIYGYGGELTFGWDIIRLGGGYAIGKNSLDDRDEEYYMRIIINIGQ